MASHFPGRQDASPSSSDSSKQSFYTQVPESPIAVTYSTFLNNDRDYHDLSPKTSEFETETGVYTSSQQLSSSPSPVPTPTSPHKWHPTTDLGLSNNRNYQPNTSHNGEREATFFSYAHNTDEPSYLCLPPVLIRAIFALANVTGAIAGRVVETIRTGADWVPPIPPESESESESEFERDLERGLGRGKRRRVRKWKGSPPPIFLPMGVLPLFQHEQPAREVEGWEGRREGEVPLRRLGAGIDAILEVGGERYVERRDEESDDNALGRERRGSKKWKGKGKAADVAGTSGEFLGSGPRDKGKLRMGAYVPAQPDRRGTTWVPRGGPEDLGKEERYHHPM